MSKELFKSCTVFLNTITAFCDSLKVWCRVLFSNLQFISKETSEMNTLSLGSSPTSDTDLFTGYFDLSLMNSICVKLCLQHTRICFPTALSFHWFMFSHLSDSSLKYSVSDVYIQLINYCTIYNVLRMNIWLHLLKTEM